jgi:hypothetical protein
VSTCLAPLRSWMPAEWTMTIRSESQDVDDYMALTTQSALAAVIAANPPFSVVFNVWLSITPALGSRLRLWASRTSPLESVVYSFPRPQQPPASKVVVERLMRRKVFWQQAPLATATQDMEDSHLPPRACRWFEAGHPLLLPERVAPAQPIRCRPNQSDYVPRS